MCKSTSSVPAGARSARRREVGGQVSRSAPWGKKLSRRRPSLAPPKREEEPHDGTFPGPFGMSACKSSSSHPLSWSVVGVEVSRFAVSGVKRADASVVEAISTTPVLGSCHQSSIERSKACHTRACMAVTHHTSPGIIETKVLGEVTRDRDLSPLIYQFHELI